MKAGGAGGRRGAPGWRPGRGWSGFASVMHFRARHPAVAAGQSSFVGQSHARGDRGANSRSRDLPEDGLVLGNRAQDWIAGERRLFLDGLNIVRVGKSSKGFRLGDGKKKRAIR